MEWIEAKDINRFDNWTCLIYAEAGKGKTSMLKSLTGRTVMLSVDGMYQVIAGMPEVKIMKMNEKKVIDEMGDFYKFLLKNIGDIDNIVIDNLSTLQKFWLNNKSHLTKSGMPELKDYAVFDRIIVEFIASLKALNKNLLLFAHEQNAEITLESGRVYTQFQPMVRNIDTLMGIIPLVGRLIIHKNEENGKESRLIILQPTQTIKAKDQLIGDVKYIGQMELLPKLQEE